MSRVEVLSGRSGAGGGARSRSDRSLRKPLRPALRFARSRGSGLCQGSAPEGGGQELYRRQREWIALSVGRNVNSGQNLRDMPRLTQCYLPCAVRKFWETATPDCRRTNGEACYYRLKY